MAIQMRRGPWTQFDPTKMLPGEWAIVLSGHPDTTDGMAVYHCFAAGVVKQISTVEEVSNIVATFVDEMQDALAAMEQATDDATDAAERAEDAIEAIGDISVLAVPQMSASTRGGAKLGDGDGLALDGEKLVTDPLTTSQIDDIVGDTSVTSGKVLNGTLLTYLWTKIKAAFATIAHTHTKSQITDFGHTHGASDIASGTLGVARGGTGAATHTSNAVLTGNGTGAVNNVATASGALYATAADGAASFGTLPVAQGGTGATAAAAARTNLDAAQSDGATGTLKSAETGIGSLASSIASVESSTAAASHAQGSHFVLHNVLRKATSAIAAGESITNSNSTTDTIQGQIDTLRDSVGRFAISGMRQLNIYRSTNPNNLFIMRFVAGNGESFPDISLVITKSGIYAVDESTGSHYWDK